MVAFSSAGRLAVDIGKTRAGTTVEYKPNQTIEDFSLEFLMLVDGDQFDVYSMYQWLYVRAKQKYKRNSDDYRWWFQRLQTVQKLLEEDVIEDQKSEIEIHTSYEMVQLGKKMVNNFWREI